MSLERGHFVIGITHGNQKFRPSDWIERVASVCALFDKDCRLHYNPMLRPAVLDGSKGLYIAADLEGLNPDAYAYAIEFARSNQLNIINIGLEELDRAA